MPLLVDTMFHLQRLTAARHFTWTKSKEGSGQVRTSQEISETVDINLKAMAMTP